MKTFYFFYTLLIFRWLRLSPATSGTVLVTSSIFASALFSIFLHWSWIPRNFQQLSRSSCLNCISFLSFNTFPTYLTVFYSQCLRFSSIRLPTLIFLKYFIFAAWSLPKDSIFLLLSRMSSNFHTIKFLVHSNND